MNPLFSDVYKNRKVLVTGHTGFKGSWLTYWLIQLGAEVYGYSLAPASINNHYSLLDMGISETIGDICDLKKLSLAFSEFQPEIVFHLAAQPLVHESYNSPVETFNTNVIGTVKVLEAIRLTSSVKTAILITTDKCYENQEWLWGYRENDNLGGYDPYSASKACCELAISSYRYSFFSENKVLLASCRAGNVIGGGDWAKDRLIPDLMRSASKHKSVTIRNPQSIRPWQHVLESLSGYLLIGQRLIEGQKELTGAWNFGPAANEKITVGEIISFAQLYWDNIKVNIKSDTTFHETGRLMLDCSKAMDLLNWKPVWDSAEKAVIETVEWYKAFYEFEKLLTEKQLNDYIESAIIKKINWTQ